MNDDLSRFDRMDGLGTTEGELPEPYPAPEHTMWGVIAMALVLVVGLTLFGIVVWRMFQEAGQ